MDRSKRIFLIADFKDESKRALRLQSRMWTKGLVRAGHDVQQFSYRNMLTRHNSFVGKKLSRLMPGFTKKTADKLLMKQIRDYHPDIIFLFGMKYFDAKTVELIRQTLSNAVIVGRDEDPFPEQNPARLAIARQTDILVNTSAGRFLQTYKDAGVGCCAFIPNVCDPDIQYKYDVEEKWNADIIFTGKPTHTRLDHIGDRYFLIKKISDMPRCRVYGAFGIPRVEGLDYFHALSGAKIGLSINITNDVQLYHSDRLINYLSCGLFVLAKRVPDSQLLFEDGVHLRYFDDNDEFFELAEWYLKHEKEREKIAQAGMRHAHQEYNCTVMARHFIEFVEKGKCLVPWNFTI